MKEQPRKKEQPLLWNELASRIRCEWEASIKASVKYLLNMPWHWEPRVEVFCTKTAWIHQTLTALCLYPGPSNGMENGDVTWAFLCWGQNGASAQWASVVPKQGCGVNREAKRVQGCQVVGSKRHTAHSILRRWGGREANCMWAEAPNPYHVLHFAGGLQL